MCGFAHSTFVTVPLNSMGLVLSYSAANEWCAMTGTAAASKPTITRPSTPRFIAIPPQKLEVLKIRIIDCAIMHVKRTPLLEKEGWREAPGWSVFDII